MSGNYPYPGMNDPRAILCAGSGQVAVTHTVRALADVRPLWKAVQKHWSSDPSARPTILYTLNKLETKVFGDLAHNQTVSK